MVKNILFVSVLVICFVFSGCRSSAKDQPVVLVDRNAYFSNENEPDPMRLVVEINETGSLRLNKIEIGTLADVTELTEKITVIFEDRRIALIEQREVLIDPQGNVKREDLDRLIENLAGANASPIRILERRSSEMNDQKLKPLKSS